VRKGNLAKPLDLANSALWFLLRGVEQQGTSEIARLAALSAQLAREYGPDLKPDFALEAISVLQEIQQLARFAIDAAVSESRTHGATWQEIAVAAGCSRQNAFKRWHRVDGPSA
jgi:CRP-like cAMP-binding protein